MVKESKSSLMVMFMMANGSMDKWKAMERWSLTLEIFTMDTSLKVWNMERAFYSSNPVGMSMKANGTWIKWQEKVGIHTCRNKRSMMGTSLMELLMALVLWHVKHFSIKGTSKVDFLKGKDSWKTTWTKRPLMVSIMMARGKELESLLKRKLEKHLKECGKRIWKMGLEQWPVTYQIK